MDFWDSLFGDKGYVTTAGNWLSSDAGKGLTNIAGLGMGLYGINQAKDAYDFNKSQVLRDNAIQDTNTDVMTSAYDTIFNKKKKETTSTTV